MPSSSKLSLTIFFFFRLRLFYPDFSLVLRGTTFTTEEGFKFLLDLAGLSLESVCFCIDCFYINIQTLKNVCEKDHTGRILLSPSVDIFLNFCSQLVKLFGNTFLKPEQPFIYLFWSLRYLLSNSHA